MFGGLKNKFSSWNCRGLQKLKKIKQVMTRVKSNLTYCFFRKLTCYLVKKQRLGGGGRVVYTQHPLPLRQKGLWSWSINPYHFMWQRFLKTRLGGILSYMAHLLQKKINLINIYAPNNDDPNFFHNLFLTMSSLSGSYIMAGYFNSTLNPELDRSSGIDTSHSKSRQNIQYFMKELNLRDIWRDMNPNHLKHTAIQLRINHTLVLIIF